MKHTLLWAASLLLLATAVSAQTTGNIAVFKQTETTKSTELRADLEEVGSAKRGVKVGSFSFTLRHYVIYDITNGKTAIIAYNPSYLVSVFPFVTRKYYWVQEVPSNTFAFTRLPLPQAGAEQWLYVSGDEYVHESSPGNPGLDNDSVVGPETWGLLGETTHWSGKATPFTFSDGFIAPVPRTISIKGLGVAQEFRYRSGSTYTYLTHTTSPFTGTLILDVAVTGKANKNDIVIAADPPVPPIPKRTIENGVEQAISALKAQGYGPRP